jgi:hypothetical protein
MVKEKRTDKKEIDKKKGPIDTNDNARKPSII